MYNFILQIAIMLSLGTVIYLMARAVPRMGDEISKPPVKFDRWIDSIKLEKIDIFLNNFIEKFLRKIKLFLMKLDNVTNDYLDKIKKTKPNGNSQKSSEEKPSLFNSTHKEEGDTES
jgi:ABC-type amino acid transport substrate-binding protein